MGGFMAGWMGLFPCLDEDAAEGFGEGAGFPGVFPVKDVAAHFLVFHDTGLAQDAQVVGDGRLGQAELFRDLGDVVAVLAVAGRRQQVEDLQAHDVPHRPELAGEFLVCPGCCGVCHFSFSSSWMATQPACAGFLAMSKYNINTRWMTRQMY